MSSGARLACVLTGALVLHGCGGGASSTSPRPDSVIRTVAVAPTKPAPGSKTLRDPDLPFLLRYPPPYVVARADPQRKIFARLGIDHWNVILFIRDDKMPYPMTDDDLERSFVAHASEHPHLLPIIRERPGKVEVFRFTLPRRIQTAGRFVGARVIYFAPAGEVWEIACTFTSATRKRAIRACDQIASTLRV